ncbi:MAG: hypothetical protein ACXQTS_03195 [Candidatus Methanospirareceae archaeon]
MGMFGRLFKRRREEKILSPTDMGETGGEDGFEGDLENLEDLERHWLQRWSGGGKVEEGGEERIEEKEVEEKEVEEKGVGEEEEKEEKKEDAEKISEDELISSLKEEIEEEEDFDLVLKEEMEKVGDVSAEELLELGREVLREIRGRG